MADQQETVTVHIHVEADGSHWAEVEELPGVFASGFDMAELEEALEEAIGQYKSTADRRATVKIIDGPHEVESIKEARVLVS